MKRDKLSDDINSKIKESRKLIYNTNLPDTPFYMIDENKLKEIIYQYIENIENRKESNETTTI